MAEAEDDEYVGKRGCGLILHLAELTSKELQLLQELEKQLGVALFDVKDVGMQAHDVKKLQKLEKQLVLYDKVILAFPKSFLREQLVLLINKMVKYQRAFVTVIMYQNDFVDFPHDLDEFKIRRVMVDKNMQNTEGIAGELKQFIEEDSKKLNLAFLNFGNGLAWSYYFGYLTPMLLGLKAIIMDSKWRTEGAGTNVPEKDISRRMLIYPRVEIQKNQLKLGRLKFHRNQVQVNRAGIDRIYEIDIREVKSQDGSETYYVIADYANCLSLLTKLNAETTKDFFKMDEDMMKKQGRFFYERLKLFLQSGRMQNYNKKYAIDSSKFVLMDYNGSPRNEPEEQLVEDLFQKTRKECTSSSQPVAEPDAQRVYTGIISLPGVAEDVKGFVAGLQRSDSAKDLFGSQDFMTALKLTKKVFLVLTDDFVNSPNFEAVFYAILHHVCKENNRRLLVCLDCLDQNSTAKDHPALQLLSLFKCIRYSPTEEWKDKVQAELRGDPQEVTYDLMFHNVGTGFALSYYYAFLKHRIPGMSLFVENTPALMRKFEEGLMSYKLFILHPHSCKTGKKVSDADPRVVDRDDDEELKQIKFPEVMNDRRVYSPKISSIIDPESGKKYYVFVEFSTQAETLHRMMREGFLDKDLLSREWARYCNKLNQIIAHPNEPLECKNRMQIIQYDSLMENDIAMIILERVKEEIKKEKGNLIRPCP